MFDALFRDRGLSLDRLRTFCMVAEADGVTKAAGKNANRQSQFSRQISELERFFGIQLMERHGKGITLTPSGKRLIKIAREIFVQLEDFNSHYKSEPQRFSIGAGDALLQWLLFPNVGALQKALPTVGIDVYGLPTLEIVDRITDLRLDFGLVRRDAIAPGQKFQSLGLENYALFVPRQLLSSKKPQTVKEVIAKVPLTTIAGEGRFRASLQRQAQKDKLPLSFSLCCSTFPQAARALRSGRYAAILPTIAADELDLTRFVTLPVPFLEPREICLIWNPRSAKLRPQTNAVKDCLLMLLKFPSKD
jgi:DNA-binding transcriptional LysR family regulator